MRHKAGFWVLLSLVAVLCFLGYLQYRWIDRLAKAEAEREQQTLRAAISRLTSAFDVEVTRAQLAFGPIPMQFDPVPYWTGRAQIWNEFAPYPRIVKEVLVRQHDRTFRLTAAGLVPVEGSIETGADPMEVMPIGRPGAPAGLRTIVFDGEYIRKDLLPQLASRYLQADRYGVRISDGDRVVFAENEFRPEIITRMFSFRPECFGGGMRGDRRRGPRPGPRPGPPPGLMWREGGPGFISRGNIPCPEPPSGRESGKWTVEAGFAASSVAGLHEFRTRSLLLSFGVLAVLATGIGMLGLYAYRAQVLAQRQMEFAMAVSHELRTPLTVIRVAADSLSEGMAADPRKYGEMIRRETVRLSDMVEQVLVFARTQRADILPHFEAVSPSEIIDRALLAAGPALEAAGMRVECDVPKDLPAIRADANLMSAGLQNLLINAAKYAISGGVVRLRAEQSEKLGITIVVQDEGPGVRPVEIDRVFSPFYRGSDAANSPTPGLGLGLHLVKRIIEAHGGSVSAHNRSGRGFQVEMRIPASES